MELPIIEIERLSALDRYHILDTNSEAGFDDMTRLAAYICQTPIAAISLIDAERQWYKSKIGFISSETARDNTFCAYAVAQKEFLIVEDAFADQRFADSRFVNGEVASIRFYAGAPLITPDGFVVGTLCVLDYAPRQLSCQQQEALQTLAFQVVTQLELRRNLQILEQNVAERQKSEEKLKHNAFHDALTSLPNRAHFIKRLQQAISQAKWQAEFAVLFVDLDRFKLVNDSLGHMVGDKLLVAIAQRLKTCLRPEDVVARLGGDEFAILLEQIKDVSDAVQVAKRIQDVLALPFNLAGQEIFTSASVGIARSTAGYMQPEDLLRDADTAMYRAKALGKARYAVFDTAMHDQVVSLLKLETDLQQAIRRREFQIYYQPIVSLKTGKIISFEALVRWQHPGLGLLSPAEFISVAEETGAIIPMGYWLLQEACLQLHAWQFQYPEKQLSISVNLSSRQFSHPCLIEHLRQILCVTGLNQGSLKLEITESTIMENSASATDMLAQLRELEIDLHMDDFGTGYSSLSYLHRFPVDILKIDRSFINELNSSKEKAEIVRTIVMLARNLCMQTTAEGIETAEQLAQLRSLQCDYGQGYFFSEPVDREAAAELIAQDLLW